MENQCSISIFTDLAKTSTLEVMKMSPNLKDNSKMVEPMQRERYVLRGFTKGLGGVIKGLWGVIKVLLAFSSKFVKVEKILKGSLVLIPLPSPTVKIQIMDGKVCLRCKGKKLLSIVNKLFVFKSLLTMPSNVLPLHLKQTVLPMI